MDNMLKEVKENISGIWDNEKYELTLGLDSFFFFEEKESEEIIDGTYSIVQDAKGGYIILRLTELDGTNHDCVLIELSAFKTLTIIHKDERILFKNVSPDEYEGEIINPSNN